MQTHTHMRARTQIFSRTFFLLYTALLPQDLGSRQRASILPDEKERTKKIPLTSCHCASMKRSQLCTQKGNWRAAWKHPVILTVNRLLFGCTIHVQVVITVTRRAELTESCRVLLHCRKYRDSRGFWSLVEHRWPVTTKAILWLMTPSAGQWRDCTKCTGPIFNKCFDADLQSK